MILTIIIGAADAELQDQVHTVLAELVGDFETHLQTADQNRDHPPAWTWTT
jgi:hypothetical protein